MLHDRRRPHNVYIKDDLWEAAAKVGRDTQQSTAQIINHALECYLGREDAEQSGESAGNGSGPDEQSPPSPED